MNKKILAGIAVFALIGGIISMPMVHSAYAAESKTVNKDTKITSKKVTVGKSGGKSSSPNVEFTKGSGDSESCSSSNKCLSVSQLKVAKGATVTWTNKDSTVHTVTSGTIKSGPDGKFDSGLVAAGAKFSQKFDSAGTYNYFDMVHPWIQGKVIVS
jgi:plastocyanin